MWCVAELDEEYIRRMEDILAVYEKPLSEREPVVCVDEKPVVLHQEVRPPQAMGPGRVARRDGEYQRCGTANVFCGVEPKAGRYFPKVTAHRSSPEFADYQSVNGLLNTVMPSALSMLAADTLGVLAEDTGKIGRLLAFWDIRSARNLAWDFANHLRGLSGVTREVALSSQDALTGALGRAILAF